MLPLYAFFALSSTPDAVVEMVVSDPSAAFIDNHAAKLSWLLAEFGSDSLCARNMFPNMQNRTKTSNTYRFLEQPVRNATFTYIGDVDIFLTQSVLDPRRLQQMQRNNIPYSNIIRPNTTRLTGLMLLHTRDFYTPELLQAQQDLDANGNDEEFLYQLVNASGLGLPGTNETYRPAHGLHLSTNRGPGKRICLPDFENDTRWCHVLSMPRLQEFLCIINSVNQHMNENLLLLDAIAQVSLQMESNMVDVKMKDGTTVCQ